MSRASLVALVAVTVGTAFAGESRRTVIPEAQMAVAGVQLGASRMAVGKVFGPELRVHATHDPIFCDSEVEVFYSGVEAYFCGGSLVNLVCTTSRYRTPAGLFVGMAVEEATRRQGTTDERTDDEHGLRLAYRNDDESHGLFLYQTGGKISRIELWSDFT